VRCWSAADDAGLVPSARPEIVSADLTALALDLAVAGFADPADLPWLDPPPSAAFAEGRKLLILLGALDGTGAVTAHGRAMAALGAHPRLAHLLLVANSLGPASQARAAVLAALLEERDLVRGDGAPPPSDVRLRLDALERHLDPAMLGGAAVDHGAVARVREAAERWRRALGGPRADPSAAEDAGTLQALAYPDRVARRRGESGRYLLRNGRGASLPVGDALAQEEWLVVVAVDDAGRDGRIQLAAPGPARAVAAPRATATTDDETAWDEATRRVVARRVTRLDAIVMEERTLPRPAPEALRPVMLDVVRRTGIAALPWSDGAARLRQRMAFVHAHDATWPDVGDEALATDREVWLGPFLDGVDRWEALARVDLTSALLTRLTWEQRAALDVRAPERLEVPTGSRLVVDYSDVTAPVLAVRLQEVFGMAETPRVLGGQVPVVLHLLSPGYRPVQVTRDLASFWRTGYFDVRKDLRGRYPKHHWPDDPLTAVAVRGVPRRR
jgi:ATP-dependent helicase HrpB